MEYFFFLNLLWRTDLLEVGAFLHVNFFRLSRMCITFFLVTLCACAMCYNYPCVCANKGALSSRLLFFSFHCLYSFGSTADVLILIVIFSMAACDKCSFGYFQVIAEFYNIDAKSLSFLRSSRGGVKVRAVFIIIIIIFFFTLCCFLSSRFILILI